MKLLHDFPATDEELYELYAGFEKAPQDDPEEVEIGFDIYNTASHGGDE